jgi:PAS domain S-box-containing protein
MTVNETKSVNERSKKPNRKIVTASKELIIISAIFIFVSVLVDVFGVFGTFQEWVRKQPQWTKWHVHDYIFVFVILSLALGVFSLRRWIELRREIAERRRAEDALRQSEERFRSVAQSATDAIIVANSKGNIIVWNKAAQAIFGYDDEEALGKPLTLLMPERFHDSHRRGLDRFLSAGKSDTIGKTVEYVGRNKDGSEFPLELSLASWRAGEEVFFTGIIRDVTERKLAEEASKQAEEVLRESEERFTAFMNNSPVVAWLKDPATWTFSYVNNAFEKVFDITQEVIRNKTDFDLWPEEIARQLRENDLRVMSSDKTIHTSEDVPLPDGTVHHWLVFKFPLHTPSGKVLLAGTAVDITERRRMEEEREKMVLELQGALAKVKTLSGLLPICASCKKIRNDKGYWNQIEGYIMEHSEATFSHGICPDCAQKLYPDHFKK